MKKGLQILAYTILGLALGWYGSVFYYRIVKVDPEFVSASSYTDMLALINKDREKFNLKPLERNLMLEESAKAKACDMRDKNYFEHVSPDGKQPWDFIKDAGFIDYERAGENIAKDFDSTKQMAEAYMQSEAHRDNILDPDYTEVGIGVCGRYQVEHFASYKK